VPLLYTYDEPVPDDLRHYMSSLFAMNRTRLDSKGPRESTPDGIVAAYGRCIPDARDAQRIVAFDPEPIYDNPLYQHEAIDTFCRVINAFKAQAPDLLRYVPVPRDPTNYQGWPAMQKDYDAATRIPSHRLNRMYKGWQRVALDADLVEVPGVLTRQESVDDDLLRLNAGMILAERWFPHVQPVIYVWGNLHTAWNPDNVKLTPPTLSKYIAALRGWRGRAQFMFNDPKSWRDLELIQALAA
jgi:hypothetical protein